MFKNYLSCLKHTRIVFLMFSIIYNGISEYLRPLKLLVTKVSAQVGFCRLFSHCSTYIEMLLEAWNVLYDYLMPTLETLTVYIRTQMSPMLHFCVLLSHCKLNIRKLKQITNPNYFVFFNVRCSLLIPNHGMNKFTQIRSAD